MRIVIWKKNTLFSISGALTLVSPGDQMESPISHIRPAPPMDPRNLVPVRPPVSPSQVGRSRLVAPLPDSSRHSGRTPGTLQRNVRVPPLPPPPPPAPHNLEGPNDFYWKRVGNTECSATCGKGEPWRARDTTQWQLPKGATVGWDPAWFYFIKASVLPRSTKKYRIK